MKMTDEGLGSNRVVRFRKGVRQRARTKASWKQLVRRMGTVGASESSLTTMCHRDILPALSRLMSRYHEAHALTPTRGTQPNWRVARGRGNTTQIQQTVCPACKGAATKLARLPCFCRIPPGCMADIAATASPCNPAARLQDVAAALGFFPFGALEDVVWEGIHARMC